jgi:hypothetical protein
VDVDNAVVYMQNIPTDCNSNYTTINLFWSGIEYRTYYQYCVGTNYSKCDISNGWKTTTSQSASISSKRGIEIYFSVRAGNCLGISQEVISQDSPLIVSHNECIRYPGA